MKKASGFTLVEILIVVVILGILAAIVIPQFTNASTQAKESRLVSDLQSMRSQIELFKIQHNDNLPGWQGATFTLAMTGYTSETGAVVDFDDPNAVFGPYLQKIPSNPWISGSTANDVTEGTATPAPATGGGGWYFNTQTGAFHADDQGTTEENVAHSTL